MVLPVTYVTSRYQPMYNKIFTKILDSSVWLEPTPTRIVWFTFLAAMDETGFVQFASAANVAHRARVELAEAETALTCLESPDPHSSDPEFEGRRVERVPGGWMILNAAKYRDLVTRTIVRAQTRQRVQNYRDRLKSQNLTEKPRNSQQKRSKRDTPLHARNGALNVTRVTSSDTDTDTDTKIPLPINKLIPKTETLSTSNGNGHASLSPAAPKPADPKRDPFTDRVVTERAGRFVDRYQELYPEHRNGARYAVKPARDYAAAVTLCTTWADDGYLEKLAVVFLTTDHKFAAEGSRTLPQFLAIASWCDGRLRDWATERGVTL